VTYFRQPPLGSVYGRPLLPARDVAGNEEHKQGTGTDAEWRHGKVPFVAAHGQQHPGAGPSRA